EGDDVVVKKSYRVVFLIVLVISASVVAQSQNPPPVSTVIAVLSETLDAKTASVGQEVVLDTSVDVRAHNEVIIPKGSRIIAQVAGGETKGRNEQKSFLVIRIKKVVIEKGLKIPLQAIIAAIAAPPSSLESDPTYAMMHSNEPKMTTSAQGTASSG